MIAWMTARKTARKPQEDRPGEEHNFCFKNIQRSNVRRLNKQDRSLTKRRTVIEASRRIYVLRANFRTHDGKQRQLFSYHLPFFD